MHSSQLTTILKFLRQGDCGCFLFGSIFPQFPELIGIPVDPPIQTRVGLVWKKGRHISMALQTFLDFARTYQITGNVSES